jgi:hypothetical protein
LSREPERIRKTPHQVQRFTNLGGTGDIRHRGLLGQQAGYRPKLMVTCDGAGASHDLIARLDGLAWRSWNSSNATASSVTDSSDNSYTELTHFKASDGTELSVWTVPITAGGGPGPPSPPRSHPQPTSVSPRWNTRASPRSARARPRPPLAALSWPSALRRLRLRGYPHPRLRVHRAGQPGPAARLAATDLGARHGALPQSEQSLHDLAEPLPRSTSTRRGQATAHSSAQSGVVWRVAPCDGYFTVA